VRHSGILPRPEAIVSLGSLEAVPEKEENEHPGMMKPGTGPVSGIHPRSVKAFKR
jgi:hypothetical protein